MNTLLYDMKVLVTYQHQLLLELTRVQGDLIRRIEVAEREIQTRGDLLSQFSLSLIPSESQHGRNLMRDTVNQDDREHSEV